LPLILAPEKGAAPKAVCQNVHRPLLSDEN
jgi:hypothetical protein